MIKGKLVLTPDNGSNQRRQASPSFWGYYQLVASWTNSGNGKYKIAITLYEVIELDLIIKYWSR